MVRGMMEMMELVKWLIVLGFSFVSIVLFVGGVKIIFANKADYRSNQQATGGILNALKGNLPTFKDGRRSHKVGAGLVFDVRKRKLTEQGTLSDEAINSILK